MAKRSKQPAALPDDFGPAVRQIRTAKGIGLRTLAKWADISPAYLSRIEQGKVAPPSEECIVRLAVGLEYDASELVARAGRTPESVQWMLDHHPLDLMRICDGLAAIAGNADRKIVLHGLGGTLEAVYTLAALRAALKADDTGEAVRSVLREYKRIGESMPERLGRAKADTIKFATSLLDGEESGRRALLDRGEQAGKSIAILAVGLLHALGGDDIRRAAITELQERLAEYLGTQDEATGEDDRGRQEKA